ncbi:hypothetical protein ACJMK2_012232, partial [Sinanodonta woodiana]
GNIDDRNNIPSQEIPELISTMTLSSVPPGSTWANFPSKHHIGRPTTAREINIQDGHCDQTKMSTDISCTKMGGETQELAHNAIEETMQLNKNGAKKHKEKSARKHPKKKKHISRVDKEYEDIQANTEDYHKYEYINTDDDRSVFNAKTQHSNAEGQDNGIRMKIQRAKEYNYSDEEMKNASPETGSNYFSEHHSKRRVATIYQFNDNLPDNPNYRVKHNQGYGGLFDNPAATPVFPDDPNYRVKHNQRYDELFDKPVATPVIEEHSDLNYERFKRKSRNKDEKYGNEDITNQVGPDSNEMPTVPTDNTNVIKKEKKKKRKKTRERSNENVQNGYDQIGDSTTARSIFEGQSDLPNDESGKKHRKKRKKKHKKRDKMNAAKQEDIHL